MNQNEQYYPKYVTQKEMCRILGMCKSTAYIMRKKGMITFKYESMPYGRRQQVQMADIIVFQNRQRYFRENENDFVNALRQYFSQKLNQHFSILTVSDIICFTGYAKTTINNWIARGKLKSLCYKEKPIYSLTYGRGNLIAKEEVVSFLAGFHYRSIRRKSELHKRQEQEYMQILLNLLRSKEG